MTTATSCVKCHSRMNELGYPLESFDDFGRFRTLEKLEHPDNLLKENGKYGEDTYKTKPVITTGKLDGTGDPKLRWRWDWKGVPIPEMPGKSLTPAIAKDVTIEREFLWWLHDGNRAIRVGDWKLVAAVNQPWELYDLSTDRAEQKNLAEKMPEKAKELSVKWQRQTDLMVELLTKENKSK